MAAEDEESVVSLKEIVQQTLEARGLFAKIRAQLMASVFEVFEDPSDSTQYLNPCLHRVLSSEEGRLILSLVKDFLDFFGLEASSSVLATECAFDDFEDRPSLARTFDIEEDPDAPVLQRLVQSRLSGCESTGSTSHNHLPKPLTISTPIQPPKMVDDDSSRAISIGSPSLDLGGGASPSASKSRIPVPTSPTAAKKEGFTLHDAPSSGIPRPKSASSVSSNSSSGSDRFSHSKEDPKPKKSSPSSLNDPKTSSTKGSTVSNGPSISLTKPSHGKPLKKNDFDFDDFGKNDEDDLFNEDDLFGPGAGKKERVTTFPSRRRREESAEGLKGNDRPTVNGGFLSDLPPLKTNSDNYGAKDEKSNSKQPDWLAQLGFDDDEKDSSDNSKGPSNGTKEVKNGDAGSKKPTPPAKATLQKKATLSNSEDISEELPESVDEYSFASDEEDDDLTTDKTFSDADAALKKVDYTENVRAIV